MDPSRLLRLSPSASLKEKRLASLLQGRGPSERLIEAVENAQVLGSLELAGLPTTLDELDAARAGGDAPAAVRGLLRALQVVEPRAPVTIAAFQAWNAAVTGGTGAMRVSQRWREGGPPPAPAEFIATRLALLQEWMNVESGRELKPSQQGALVLARIVEILPFEEGNGRVARLAASHVMVRAGRRPPLLGREDEGRLPEALKLAFRFETEPLSTLLEEASERAVDVMIRTLEDMG